MRKMKRVEDSRTENTYLIMNKHINSYGRLFGGVLMQWIDEMAGIVAHRHAGTIVTTACVDNLNFKAGAYLGNTVVLIGRDIRGKNIHGSTDRYILWKILTVCAR